MEARMLRNYLIFTGHPEMLSGDDCITIIVTNVLKNRLKLDLSTIHITKAYRVGKLQAVLSLARTNPKP